MKDQWLDIDMDYFAGYADPIAAFRRMITKIPRKTPCSIVVEHQEVLGPMKYAVRSGKLSKPFDLYHADEHHDAYGADSETPREGRKRDLNCGTYILFVPLKWMKSFHWVTPPTRNVRVDYEEWDETPLMLHGEEYDSVTEYFARRGITCVEDFSPKWNPNRVGLVTIAVSPDYMEDALSCAANMVHFAAEHFRVKKAPCPPLDYDFWSNPDEWEMEKVA